MPVSFLLCQSVLVSACACLKASGLSNTLRGSNPPDVVTVDDKVFKSYVKEGTVDGLSYYGTSLMLVTKTSIRHYFEVSEGEISEYTFTCNDQKLTPVKKGARYYVEITDIVATELDEMYSLTVTKGTNSMTLTYGPFI